jgi:hypothetical protein
MSATEVRGENATMGDGEMEGILRATEFAVAEATEAAEVEHDVEWLVGMIKRVTSDGETPPVVRTHVEELDAVVAATKSPIALAAWHLLVRPTLMRGRVTRSEFWPTSSTEIMAQIALLDPMPASTDMHGVYAMAEVVWDAIVTLVSGASILAAREAIEHALRSGSSTLAIPSPGEWEAVQVRAQENMSDDTKQLLQELRIHIIRAPIISMMRHQRSYVSVSESASALEPSKGQRSSSDVDIETLIWHAGLLDSCRYLLDSEVDDWDATGILYLRDMLTLNAGHGNPSAKPGSLVIRDEAARAIYDSASAAIRRSFATRMLAGLASVYYSTPRGSAGVVSVGGGGGSADRAWVVCATDDPLDRALGSLANTTRVFNRTDLMEALLLLTRHGPSAVRSAGLCVTWSVAFD